MDFNLKKSIEILERTPLVLEIMLKGIDNEWIVNNEGVDTWSPYDVVGHLIHGEKTDWIPRLEIILSDDDDNTFEPFDRFAQFEEDGVKTLNELLAEFRNLREMNIQILKSKFIKHDDYSKTGIHPAFGEVTLGQLLATWTVHDLNHIAQITRVMAKQYTEAVGPWIQYLRILN